MTILSSRLQPLSSFLMFILILLILLLGSTSETMKDHDQVVDNLDPYDSSDESGLFDSFCDSKNPDDPTCESPIPPDVLPIYKMDILLLQFAQNLEHLEADFFLWAALGYGLDVVAPWLTQGGPPPIGVRKANLDNPTRGIIREFGLEEIGHLRALKRTVGGIKRPLMDLSPENFARIVDKAFEQPLEPSFDPYRDSLSFMLASYIIPYLGVNGYVGSNPLLKGYVAKGLLAGLLGIEAGQDATIRTYLYERALETVHPYKFTVAEFTNRISVLRNTLGMCGIKDESILVQPEVGAEGNSSTNVLSSNRDDLAYPRTPAEILRITYASGDEHVPGGFYPEGANGKIARMYLNETTWD